MDNDEDDDEEGSSSIFYNDLYKLDLTNHKWSPLVLRYFNSSIKNKKIEFILLTGLAHFTK